jgi:hypothetical protein
MFKIFYDILLISHLNKGLHHTHVLHVVEMINVGTFNFISSILFVSVIQSFKISHHTCCCNFIVPVLSHGTCINCKADATKSQNVDVLKTTSH